MDSIHVNLVENPHGTPKMAWEMCQVLDVAFFESKQILHDSSWLQFSLCFMGVPARSVGRQSESPRTKISWKPLALLRLPNSSTTCAGMHGPGKRP